MTINTQIFCFNTALMAKYIKLSYVKLTYIKLSVLNYH